MRAYRTRWAVTLVGALALALLPALAGAQQPAADRSGLEHACPEGRVPDSGFTDSSPNTHEDAIECAAWWEITRGGPAGRPPSEYGPELDIPRDQMASFIARMIDESEGEPLPAWDGSNRFADVDSGNVHMQNINRLAQAGVVLGRTDTEYAPKMIVRRDQMASFIARAIRHVTGEDRASEVSYFLDVPQDNPHRTNINGLFEQGVVQGRAPGQYAPADNVRRDAMASFVMRGVDLHVEEGFATPPDERDEEPPVETPEETPGDTPEPSTSDFPPQTAAPELQGIEAVTLTTTTASVRFTFSHGIVADDVDEEGFYLYGINSDEDRHQASSATRDTTTSVLAIFDREHFDKATTAAVTNAAVRDLNARANPERALGLKSLSFPAGQTTAPDLQSVGNFRAGSGGAALADFLFDQTVAEASTSGGSFGLVLANGSQVTGDAAAAEPSSTTVTVSFANQSFSTLAANARRAFTQAGAATGEGGSSPRRAVAAAEGGVTATPNLVGITISKAADRVTYEFDDVVADSGPNAPQVTSFSIYYIDGTQRSAPAGTITSPNTPTVSSDGRRVTVQFGQGHVNDLVVGAAVDANAVRSLDGWNGVDSRGLPSEFVPGQVLGPRLMSASLTEGQLTSSVVWRFDKPVDIDDGGFVVYTANGTRITTSPSAAGRIDPASCSRSDQNRTVTCSLLAPPGTDVRLASVEHAAVENSADQTGASGTRFPNYEQSRPVS